MLPTLIYVFTGYNPLKEGTGEESTASYASDSTIPVEPTPSLGLVEYDRRLKFDVSSDQVPQTVCIGTE
ncbi:unnamed protein product [Penicillium discolor]